MDFSKEINDVVRKSINHRNLSDNYEDSVAYSETLCNKLADKIAKLVEGQKPTTNPQSTQPCPIASFHSVLPKVQAKYCCECGVKL